MKTVSFYCACDNGISFVITAGDTGETSVPSSDRCIEHGKHRETAVLATGIMRESERQKERERERERQRGRERERKSLFAIARCIEDKDCVLLSRMESTEETSGPSTDITRERKRETKGACLW